MAQARKKTAAKRAPARKKPPAKKRAPAKRPTKARTRAPAKKAPTRATKASRPRSKAKPLSAHERRNAIARQEGYRNAYEKRQVVAAERERKAKAHEAYVRRRDAKIARELKGASAYERRNARAQAAGYESYWDERQSRTRAREALRDLGHPNPDAQDAATLADVDQLGRLGRGESARELYYKTRKILEKYEPGATDRQVWALIRIFYKPRGHR